MINYLAMVEQNKCGYILLFLLLVLFVIVFLAYLPRKEKPKKYDDDIHIFDDDTDVFDETPNIAPDYSVVKKKLYSAITSVFDDTLHNEGKIIIYATPERNILEEPLTSVITLLLPNNMLYLKFDYKLDTTILNRFRKDCIVKLDPVNQSADIYTELRHHDTLSDDIELTLAVGELIGSDISATWEA